MRLETLLGYEEHDIWTSKRKKDNIILKRKFCSLVKRFKLKVEKYEDGLLSAKDDSGEILYKKVMDYEWFCWKPNLTISSVAKDIFDMTDGFLLVS